MAVRTQPLGPSGTGGIAAALALVALVVAALFAVALRAEGDLTLGAADRAAIWFTLWQAAVSAGLSVALAIPLARALARRRFPGRQAFIVLLGAPFILPVIVAVFGLIAIFGRNGWLNAALDAVGLERISIYGAGGVILAHVFLNLPLATRLVLQGWAAIPAERIRLAHMLGMGPAAVGRILERPMLREVVPGAALVIFVICTTSFAVALTLGGGPRATTIELAIYQALRFDFDPGAAAVLAGIQLALTGVAALLLLTLSIQTGFGSGLDRMTRLPAGGRMALGLDTLFIAAAAAFLLPPLVSVFASGVGAIPALPSAVWTATLRSLAVAAAATLMAVAWSLYVAIAIARLPAARGKWLEAAGLLTIAASPLVLGTGFFLLIFPVVNPAAVALPVTAIVNALAALPFALRALVPAVRAVEADYGRLAWHLGLGDGRWLSLVLVPRIRAPLAFAAGLTAALSIGDLGVIALFAAPGEGTLPLQIYALMGAYRMDAAAGASVLLMITSLGLFWIIDRGGRV